MSEKKDLSRSEQVRLRRESNTVKRVQRARKDATRPAPPVTSRTRQTGVAPKRKPAQNARPLPVSTSTRTAGSAASAAKCARSTCRSSRCRRFRCCGRRSVIVATPSATS